MLTHPPVWYDKVNCFSLPYSSLPLTNNTLYRTPLIAISTHGKWFIQEEKLPGDENEHVFWQTRPYVHGESLDINV